ncbi:MAG TPA: 50S ribosomal protein L31, partial [Candidatus Pacearchaeota archaeon]|nr:50S ribosomal protein L31 [Candidatus Pacearchaeota archaeon]
FTVGSTQESINTEICSACHPFYTGKEKIVDSMGRVERFKKKLEKKANLSQKKS